MYIGQAAQQSGLSIKTIRFYEATGIVPPPSRRGHYRWYTTDDVLKLQLLGEARRLGFSAMTLRDLVRQAFGPGHCQRVHTLIDERRQTLTNQLQDLQQQLQALDALQQRL